jgi:chromate reductase
MFTRKISEMTKILAFAGSIRQDSYNKKLVKIAASAAERSNGVTMTYIDLADFPMPIFDQDFESQHGMPEKAREFKNILIDHDGFLIASPEYNSSYSPLLKNAIDWASRKESENDPPLQAYRGKVAAIMSASPGTLGGLRGLVCLRMLLGNLGVIVMPEQQAISKAFAAFNPDGSLANEKQQQAVEHLGIKLTQMVRLLK